jgi:Predicted pyridoxal phosphate-dependent enzyme apparently involved in regulation of cell wall biogenesis
MKNLAINGGIPEKTTPFFSWPYSDNREEELILEVVKSRKWWRMTGNKVEEFEKKFAKMHDCKYCLGLTNGTHAIEVALSALGIKPGDEVIIPAFTFISTATAVMYNNANPVLVDVDPHTFCMMPEAFEKAITAKTKVVIPVHMAGHSCDMDKICKIAKKNNIKVIEDAAHAHGAKWNSKSIGSFGDIATFSFQNGKIVTCGEGGALLTNDKEIYEKAYLLHGVGRPKDDKVYSHVVLGTNDRMNEFQAAILIAQLERLEQMNQIRSKNAIQLNKLLSGINGIEPQQFKEEATINTHYMYMFYYDSVEFGNLPREKFVDYLNAEGIPAFVAYPVISDAEFMEKHQFLGKVTFYDKNYEEDLSNARKIAKNVVWLPHFTLLGDEKDLIEIVGAIRKIQDTCTNNKESWSETKHV